MRQQSLLCSEDNKAATGDVQLVIKETSPPAEEDAIASPPPLSFGSVLCDAPFCADT